MDKEDQRDKCLRVRTFGTNVWSGCGYRQMSNVSGSMSPDRQSVWLSSLSIPHPSTVGLSFVGRRRRRAVLWTSDREFRRTHRFSRVMDGTHTASRTCDVF